MIGVRRLAWLRAVVAGALVASAVAAAPALADLPRTYQVQRVDGPAPSLGGNFGMVIANVGDANADGKDDLLVGTDKHGRRAGQVFVVSGGDGSVIRELQRPDEDPGGPGERAAGFGAAVGKIADVASCPGGDGADADAFCDAASIGPPDGVPDHLASASGVDIGPDQDVGAAYVFDGATGAALKRLLMPPADRASQTTFDADPRYGRSLLSPAGLPACAGNGGTSPCPSVPAGVAIGDLDGGGAADILAAATDFTESGAGANPESECFTQGATECHEAGRVYVFYGEAVTGAPGDDESPDLVIKNPTAQVDILDAPGGTEAEELGSLLIPVGDLGKCNADPGPGRTCAGADSTTTPDGRPDFVATSPSTNLFGMFDIGVAYLVDGEDGSILTGYEHPEPQPGSAMGLTQNGTVQPAFGDLGQSTRPDVYVPAINKHNGFTSGGRGYVFNGDFKSRFRFRAFSQLNDPTPAGSGQFGASAAGIGDVAGDSRNELLIGATGPHAPGTDENVLNDAHIFSALNERVLQTIPDPDQQGGSSFGVGVAPLGDLNGDGMLDFAIGAGLYNGVAPDGTPLPDSGRLYIFHSDNSPAPPPAGGTGSGATGGTLAVALAGRALDLEARATRVRRGRSLRLVGELDAYTNEAACERGQRVEIQRRRPGRAGYRTFDRVTTRSNGAFSLSTKPRRTYLYRARVTQSAQCEGAASQREKVSVVRSKRKSKTTKRSR